MPIMRSTKHDILRLQSSVAFGLLAAALAGCSSKSEVTSNQSDQPAVAVAAATPAPSPAPDAPNCTSLPQPDSKSDNDIADIDLGMSADDALRVAKCSKEGFAVRPIDNEAITMPDGSRPRSVFEMKKGNDLVNVFMFGPPGQEKVYGIARVTNFAGGQEPTVEQLRAKLMEKYGPLTQAWGVGSFESPNELAQVLSPEGQPLKDNRVGLFDCAQYFGQNDILGTVDGRCGLTKKVVLRTKDGNEALASGFSVWVGDQSGAIEGMKRTAQVIQAAREQQLKAERDKAAASNRVPTL
jgi:hypothetical protein